MRVIVFSVHLFLVDSQKLNLEDKIGIGRNDAASSSRAIAVGRLDVENSLLALAHGDNALIPASDDLADANGELEWPASVQGRVELLAVALESAGVVHGQLVSLLGEGLAIAGADNLLGDSFRRHGWFEAKRSGLGTKTCVLGTVGLTYKSLTMSPGQLECNTCVCFGGQHWVDAKVDACARCFRAPLLLF